MPRSISTSTVSYILPETTLNRLRERAEKDHTPMAELVRRVIDLITLFNFSLQNHVGEDIYDMATKRFSFYVGDPQLRKLEGLAAHLGVEVNEALRRGLDLYLGLKDKDDAARAEQENNVVSTDENNENDENVTARNDDVGGSYTHV